MYSPMQTWLKGWSSALRTESSRRSVVSAECACGEIFGGGVGRSSVVGLGGRGCVGVLRGELAMDEWGEEGALGGGARRDQGFARSLTVCTFWTGCMRVRC